MWRQLKTVLRSVRAGRGDFGVSIKLARKSLYALVALSTMFLTSLSVHAAPTVLQGRIGQAAVVMELEVSAENRVDGRYFYRRYLEDIALTGTREADGSLRLEERPASDKPNKLILRPQGSAWRGEWQGSRDEKPLTIELARLTKAELPASGDPALTPWIAKSPYDYVRFTSMRLRPGRYQVFQGYGLQWWIEPQSNIQFFRVATGFPQETLDQINQRLSERHWLEVERALGCKLHGLLGHGSSFEQRVTLRFINSQLLSASVFSNYYCSSAHPDFDDSPINLDIATGKELQLSDILWLGKGKAVLPINANGERKNYEYETEVQGPWLAKTMSQLYPKQAAGIAPSTNGCDYTDKNVWRFVSWYVSSRGIHFGPSFGRAIRVCEYPEWSVLPWRIVNKHPGRLRRTWP